SAGAAGGLDPRDPRLRRDDLWPRMDELDAFDRLARDRVHLLLWLREEPQPHQRTAAGNAGGNEAEQIIFLVPLFCSRFAVRSAREIVAALTSPTGRRLQITSGWSRRSRGSIPRVRGWRTSPARSAAG